MSRRPLLRAGVALACALALGGCSAAGRSGGGNALTARLTPDPAVAFMKLTVVLSDPMVDPARCRIEWRRNGYVIDGAAGSTLEPSRFARGDDIEVLVTAFDASGGLPRRASARTRVANSPPQISRVGLSMSPGELTAHVDCADPDGDVPSYHYSWRKNGVVLAGAGGASLPAASLTRGDRVVVEAVAWDRESGSVPVRSAPYVVENHPPEFQSQPTAPKPRETVFRYQATAVDPDGDTVHFELADGPAGLSVDPRGGVYWVLPPVGPDSASFLVRIRALDDKGGEAVQAFSIRLGPSPAPR